MYQIFSHCCALWQLLGFGCRKTPDLKTLYKISNKTHLLPLKTLIGALQPGGTHCAHCKGTKTALSGQVLPLQTCGRLEAAQEPTQCSKGWHSSGIPSLSRSHRLLSPWHPAPTHRQHFLPGWGCFIPDKPPGWMAGHPWAGRAPADTACYSQCVPVGAQGIQNKFQLTFRMPYLLYKLCWGYLWLSLTILADIFTSGKADV